MKRLLNLHVETEATALCEDILLKFKLSEREMASLITSVMYREYISKLDSKESEGAQFSVSFSDYEETQVSLRWIL